MGLDARNPTSADRCGGLCGRLCAWGEVTRVVIGDTVAPAGAVAARDGVRAATISVTSRTCAENARAPAQAGSPSADVRIPSERAAPGGVDGDRVDVGGSNAAIVCLANASLSSRRPACSANAPQQPWFAGATMSQPSAASSRTVASFTARKTTRWTQPVSRPTRATRLAARRRRLRAACSVERHGGAISDERLERARAAARAAAERARAEALPPSGLGRGEAGRGAARTSRSAERALELALDDVARRLDQPVVPDAGGARR